MNKTEEKFTTVRVSTDTFSRLFVIKNKLELKDKKDYSYDVVIKHLLDTEGE